MPIAEASIAAAVEGCGEEKTRKKEDAVAGSEIPLCI